MNMEGKTVNSWDKQIPANATYIVHYDIYTDDIAVGIYIINVTDSTTSITQRLVIR